MNIYDILNSYKGIPNIIRPLDLEKDEEYYSSLENYETCKKIIEDAGGDISNIVVTDAKMENVIYADVEAGVYIPIFPFVPEYLEMIHITDALKTRVEKQKKLWEEQKYEVYYFYIPDSMKAYDFQQKYKLIPKEKVAKVWEMIYTDIDFGAAKWNKDVLDYVFAHAKRKDSDKLITIYRGEGTKSTPIKDAYSWTTDIHAALWFATKGVGHKLWKAKVKERDILFRPTSRKGEKEVIVAPEDVIELEDMGLYTGDTNKVVMRYQWIEDYYLAYGSQINRLYGDKNVEAHTFSHVARVLANALLIADEECLDDDEYEMISLAALYHDCARKTDGIEEGHGLNSAKKMKDDSFFKNQRLHPDQNEVVFNLVAYHDVEDKEALPFLKELEKRTGHRVIFLYNLLKDADALDRYRFGGYRNEFNIKFLRLKESKKMLFVTAALFHLKIEEMLKQKDDDN